MQLTGIRGISTRRVEALASAGIRTPFHLLQFAPVRYLDRSTVKPLHEASDGLQASFAGVVTHIHDVRFGKRTRLEIVLSDGTGRLTGVWFNSGAWVKKQLEVGAKAVFFGTVKRFGRSMSIAHPDFESLEASDDLEHFSRIIPVYPGPKALVEAGIRSGLLSRWTDEVLRTVSLQESLPPAICEKFGLVSRSAAYRMLHQPENIREPERAKRRLAFEELFFFQSAVVRLKKHNRERLPGPVFSSSSPYTQAFFNKFLPFELTEGQRSALKEIKLDMRSGRQMNRLVQGDVGAGKTLVAIGAMLLALDNGFQAAFMAPTELLTEQHFKTLTSMLAPLEINIRLLSGSQTVAVRNDVLTAVTGGQCQILVGTHALIQESVSFYNLGIAVVDEQHRFGVAQRQALSEKGRNPHVLVMSATPIPRSLALTAYGHLDVSVVKGLPSGRKPVKTTVLKESDRHQLAGFLRELFLRGEQAFVVYPLIEASEVLDLKSARFGFEQFSQLLPGARIALLHGKMKKEERDAVMQAFLNRSYDLLISTTVIEVGIDIANATAMIIEHAERFGLAQLHQLRGRVGRGNKPGFCFLMAGKAVSADGWERLRKMELTNDGFEIAEADLALRGPGDFLGTKQSGLPDFRFADIVRDQEMLYYAREAALQLLETDPNLEMPENQAFGAALNQYIEERNDILNA